MRHWNELCVVSAVWGSDSSAENDYRRLPFGGTYATSFWSLWLLKWSIKRWIIQTASFDRRVACNTSIVKKVNSHIREAHKTLWHGKHPNWLLGVYFKHSTINNKPVYRGMLSFFLLHIIYWHTYIFVFVYMYIKIYKFTYITIINNTALEDYFGSLYTPGPWCHRVSIYSIVGIRRSSDRLITSVDFAVQVRPQHSVRALVLFLYDYARCWQMSKGFGFFLVCLLMAIRLHDTRDLFGARASVTTVDWLQTLSDVIYI